MNTTIIRKKTNFINMLYSKSKFPLTIIILICLFSFTDESGKNDYGMFRGNILHSGIYPSVEVKINPSLKWRFKTNGYINSSVAIEGDKLFFGSGDGYLYCLNTVGALVWKFKTGGAVHSSPAITDGVVLFGSHDGNFYALNSKDGKLKWTFKTEGEKLFSAKGLGGALPKDSLFEDEWDIWLSSPAIKGNTIYFGSGDGNFYALNKENGKEKWKFRTNGVIHSSPAIAFGNVYFGGWDTYLHALNAETGREVWRFKTGDDTVIYNQTGITSSPTIADSMLYFGCRDSHIYALNALSGELIWKKYNGDTWICATPVVYEDKVMYGSGKHQKFNVLNKTTGDSIYQIKTTDYFSSPAIAGKTFYYGNYNGFINARDINTGNLTWTYQLPSSIADTFHILNPDHSFNPEGFNVAYEKYKDNKTELQIRFSVGTIHSSPVIKDGVLYVGSCDGYFYALQ